MTYTRIAIDLSHVASLAFCKNCPVKILPLMQQLMKPESHTNTNTLSLLSNFLSKNKRTKSKDGRITAAISLKPVATIDKKTLVREILISVVNVQPVL
jgi:hypothetical protein